LKASGQTPIMGRARPDPGGGGGFPEDILADIRGLANIAEVISEYVVLKRAGGKNLTGLCPFHSEAKPSFSVNEERQIFHCFGCGEGGNVFSFLMKYKQMTFPEAVRELARKYGVRLPERGTPEQRGEREAILAANAHACAFFQRELAGPGGKRTRDYLKSRGFLGDDTVREFRLGYAPQGWDGLRSYLQSQGVSQDVAEKAGLLARKEGRQSRYDRFRDRLIFPIVDLGGQVVAFGGRALDNETTPKYLNSSESPVYSKSRVLYGLAQGRDHVRKAGLCLLVEGYLDFLSLWAAGVKNVVATLGTALTKSHLSLLRGMKVVVVFDSDEAGLAAAARSLGLFLQESASLGTQARLLRLPQGHDPDSYVRAEGPGLFSDAGEKSVPLLDFYMDRVCEARGDSTEGRLSAARELAPVLRQISSPVERDFYVARLARRLSLQQSAVAREVSAVRIGNDPSLEEAAQRGTVVPSLERTVLKLILSRPEVAGRFAQVRCWEEFQDEAMRRLAEAACEVVSQAGGVSSLIDRLPPELAPVASEFSLSDEWADAREVECAVCDCLAQIEKRRLGPRLAEVARKIEAAQAAKDSVALNEALREKLQLLAGRSDEQAVPALGNKG